MAARRDVVATTPPACGAAPRVGPGSGRRRPPSDAPVPCRWQPARLSPAASSRLSTVHSETLVACSPWLPLRREPPPVAPTIFLAGGDGRWSARLLDLAEDVEYSNKIGFNGFKTAGPCFSAREFKINVGYNHAGLCGHRLIFSKAKMNEYSDMLWLMGFLQVQNFLLSTRLLQLTGSLNTGALLFMVAFGLCTAISTVVSDEVGVP